MKQQILELKKKLLLVELPEGANGCNGEDQVYIIKKGDEVNSLLVAALRTLNSEQLCILRDKLIRRTKI